MGTLYINRPDFTLKGDGKSIAVYQNGERKNTLPLNLLDRVVIQHNTQMETSLLLTLAENGVSTILLSPRHSRRVAIILGKSHNDAAIRLAQALSVTNQMASQKIANLLVLSKIKHQQKLIKTALNQRPDIRKPLFDTDRVLKEIIERIKNNAECSADSLRGHEGAAARTYFQGYSALFAAELNFHGRNRRPPKDPVNATLSLSYTLLHFDAVHALHSAGLDPLLGYYHRPSYGRESLASDLIEPLRPHIDEWIWQQFREKNLRKEHFSYDQQACLLGKAGREHFFPAWERNAKTHRRWLKQQAQQLAEQLKQQGLPLLTEIDDEEES